MTFAEVDITSGTESSGATPKRDPTFNGGVIGTRERRASGSLPRLQQLPGNTNRSLIAP
jgi:hypothetical protein